MLTNNKLRGTKWKKCDKFTEYIRIAIDGDFIALGGCALTNCNTREAVFGLFVIGITSCLLARHIVRIVKMG